MSRLVLELGAWIELTPAWLAPAEAAESMQTLLVQLAWQQRHIVLFGKPIREPRLIAWAGELPYRYSGQTLEPRPWPQALSELRARVAAAAMADFNHVLINRYRHGQDSMGYHADAEPELGPDPVVASVSLGQARRFLLRRHGQKAVPPLALSLDSGSLLVMGGSLQRHYRHAVPRDRGENLGERISLTFRRVLRAPRAT